MRRDDALRYAVTRLRMTVPQLWEFSKTWEHPYHDEAGVWRRLVALKLDKKVKRVAEQSLHDFMTIKVCLKIWRDAARNNIPVWGVEKEYRVGDNSGIRADMKFYIGDRLFLLETQQTALTFRGWKFKLGKYVRYRTSRGIGPFRVIICMENVSNLNTVYRYCKELTADRPNLGLFLLGWQADILGQYCTVTEKVWVSNRQKERRPETVSLMG